MGVRSQNVLAIAIVFSAADIARQGKFCSTHVATEQKDSDSRGWRGNQAFCVYFPYLPLEVHSFVVVAATK